MGGFIMEHGVYIETALTDLKPKLYDFLMKLVEKAKDYTFAFKQKDMMDIAGCSLRTATRYFDKLKEKNIIQVKGKRGRDNGTVLMFNPELIHFETSNKAYINSKEPISIEDIVEQNFPKKPKKEPTRNRRTKQEMLEGAVLIGKQQNEFTRLNALLNGGVPSWDWFKETNDPVGNYRTYLIAKLYNRYAILFTEEHHNSLAEGEKTKVIKVSSNYDVLGQDFFGSIRWNHFEKLRKFLEENNIDPAVWLSAQFNNSIWNVSQGRAGKSLPFPNALYSDTAYNVYLEYFKYHKKGQLYAWYKIIPALFGKDIAVKAITEAYATADKGMGLWQYRGSLKALLEGKTQDMTEKALLIFYHMTKQNMRNQGVSRKSQDTIKKFVLLQSIISTNGIALLPNHTILSSELTQVVVDSVKKQTGSLEEVYRVLGQMIHPHESNEERKMLKGMEYYNDLRLLDETPHVLKLINDRKNLQLTLADIREAFNEYGNDKIPVSDYSMLDVKQVENFIMDLGLIQEEVYTPKFVEPAPIKVYTQPEPDITDYLKSFLV
jgi:hypothetical protein